MGTEDETPAPAKPVESASAVTAVTATVEHWAREKGMIPEFIDGHVDPARLKRAPKSPKPKIHNKNYAQFAATRDSLKWDPTQWPTMTEAEFDAAVAKVAEHAFH